MYKVLLRSLDGKIYYTPFQECVVSADVVEGNGTFDTKAYEMCAQYNMYYKEYVADLGYIHGYATLESVAKDISFYMDCFKEFLIDHTVEVYECETVPDDNPESCYKGKFDEDDSSSCIAAKSIRFIRRIPYEELAMCRRKMDLGRFIYPEEYTPHISRRPEKISRHPAEK